MKLPGLKQPEDTLDPYDSMTEDADGIDGLAITVNSDTEKRQKMLMFAIVAVVTVAGMAYILADDAAELEDNSDTIETVVSTDAITNRQNLTNDYFATYESEVGEQGRRLETLERGDPRLAELQNEVDSLRNQKAEMVTDGEQVFNAYAQENEQLRRDLNEARRIPRSGPAPAAAAAAAGFSQAGQGASRAPAPAAQTPAASLSRRSVNMVSFETTAGTANRVKASEGSTTYSDSPNYLPPNSMAKATVVVGVDAKTNVKSQGDPLPVVLRITGPARSVFVDGQLLRTRIQGCVVNGAAEADLSSEKVYVRLQRMTCPQPGGGVAVSNVKGFVSFGGKVGVRGRVVSREGGFTTQAFLAGLVGGLGQGFSANANSILGGGNVTIGENGKRDQLGAGEILQGGLGNGASQAGSMLQEYLIERAEQYQPVIEMPTGAKVEVVFLDGTFIRN